MVKLPISETVRKYYEETGYRFSWKEQAHFCSRDIPGLLKRIDCLGEILEKSDDEKLNLDIRMMIDYESEAYARFMENKDNRHIYIAQINYPDDRRYIRYFRTAQQAVSYANASVAYTFQTNEIKKALLMDGCDDMDNLFPAAFTFNAEGEIVDYSSSECGDDYEFDIDEFESRFDQIFLKVDCPLERGDIVISPESEDPFIVLADRDIFHEMYDAAKSQYGDKVKRMLSYENNVIPVLDYRQSASNLCCGKSVFDEDFVHGLSIAYRRPFLMEKIRIEEGCSHFGEERWDTLLEISRMVKCRYDMITLAKGVYSTMH